MPGQRKLNKTDNNLLVDNRDKLEKEKSAFMACITKYSGPIPSPDVLKKYSEVLPDAPDRIFKMAEMSLESVIDSNKKIIEIESRKISKGQTSALIIGILGILGGSFCAYIGQPTVGVAIVSLTGVTAIPGFISAKMKKKEKSDR